MAMLLGALFEQEAEFRPDPSAQLRGLEAIHADPGIGQLLVIRSEEEVLGMVSLLWSISTALGGPVACLEDLVVRKDHRGLGLGRGLLEAALALCRERGILRVTLLTDADNLAAQALYRAFGFQASAMRPMRRLLVP